MESKESILSHCTSNTPALSADLTDKGNSCHALETCEGVNNSEQDEIINMICRQTTYTRDQASEQLSKHNNDVFKVLREFMRIPEKKQDKTISMNQTIYKEIRSTLGSVPIDFVQNGGIH